MILKNKIGCSLGCLFLLVRGIGIILTLNLMPIQDPDELTTNELIAIQKKFSIHYELGDLLIDCSNCILLLLLLFLFYHWIISWKSRTK